MQKITSKKSESVFQERALRYLEFISKMIAFLVCVGLLFSAGLIVLSVFRSFLGFDLSLALQDGLFVLILLEMFYVVRSFIRYGSINVSLVVNVGIIAAIKEMIFRLDSLTMQMAIAFSIIFFTLGFTYFMEQYYYRKIIKDCKFDH